MTCILNWQIDVHPVMGGSITLSFLKNKRSTLVKYKYKIKKKHLTLKG